MKKIFSAACVAALALGAFAKEPTKVYFFLDTEDYTSDYANDSILWFADMLSEEGVRGNFAMVGFLCQRLLEYGRADVVNALKRHVVGSQTLYHSVHPNICEYSDVADWNAAYSRCLAEEATACGMIRAAFGVDTVPIFVPPGNSVTPVPMYAYSAMGTKIYGGGIDIFGQRDYGRMAWYCNMLHLPYLYDGDPKRRSLDDLAKRDYLVFYTHPNQLLLASFWDAVNYKKENLAEWRKWQTPPELKFPPEKVAALKEEWRARVRQFKNDPRFKFSDAEELIASIKPRVEIRRADVPALRAHLLKGLEPIESPASWCVADVFQAAVAFLRGAKSFAPGRVYGFLDAPSGVNAPCKVTRAGLVAAAESLAAGTFIPSSIEVDGVKLGPADYLFAALETLETGAKEVEVAPRGDQLGPIGKHLKALPTLNLSHTWINSDSFLDTWVSNRLRWQFWTLRYE